MNNYDQQLLPYTFSCMVNPGVRKCKYCGKDIPEYRNRKSEYCSDSCKSMFNRAKNKTNVPIQEFDEVELEDTQVSEQKPIETQPSIPVSIKAPIPVNEIHEAVPIPMKSMHYEKDLGNKTEKEIDNYIDEMCEYTEKIEKCANSYKQQGLYEIPINRIHSLLPLNVKFSDGDELLFPDFSLRLCLDKSKYLICLKK